MILLSVLIMGFAFCNDQEFVFHFVNKPVGIIDSPAPPSAQIVLQWFRFPNPFVRCSLRIPDQCINSFKGFLILRLLPDIILPGILVPCKPHFQSSASSLVTSCALPESISEVIRAR